MNDQEISEVLKALMPPKRKASPKTDLKARLAELRASGVESIVFSFNGYGDSGEISGYSVFPQSLQALPGFGGVELLEEFVYDHLPGGWEINEGSSGEFTFDLVNSLWDLTIDHNIMTTQTDIDGGNL